MNFAHPEKLWLLLVVPIVFLIAWVVHRRVLHRIGLFFGGDSAADVGGVVRRDHFWGRAVLTIVAMTFLLLSVAQPQWGFDWQEVRGRGASVFIALDLSQSMYAEDQKPNRLERARRKILDFLAMNTGARVGLIAFAGEALIQCPLTQDYEAVRMFLEQMSPNNMPIQGTSFSKVINLAVTTFTSIRTVADSTEALVILSDGEDHDPDINQALTEASSKGVRVFTLGFGTEEGSPIPQGGGGFKQDGSGSMVISRLQTSLLREIAEKTDGLYQRASIDDRDWHEIINRGIKENVSETEFAAGRRKQPIDRSFWWE